ncbi:MAG: hypothetical protein Q8P56_04420 [Candidatus Uhrbacteria bacterium]|nr:hypothetical protein [Candidatus Uhrbacteria bacterium]
MQPHEWLLFAVENAVLIVGLLHIYLELRKRKESQTVWVRIVPTDGRTDVKGETNGKK